MGKREREAYCRRASTPRLKGLSELPAELSLRFCSSAVLTCVGRARGGQVPKYIPCIQFHSIDVFFFQAFRRCHLKHSIALWQLLSTHKSEQLLRLKRVMYTDNFSV